MGEAKQLRDRIRTDVQALRQDNDSWKRQIAENELKIIELEKVITALDPLCDGGAQ